MKTFLFYSLVKYFILIFSCSSNGQPQAQIEQTTFIGKSVFLSNIEVHQYTSIPYAKPPIGQLRFKKPVPTDMYPTVIHAVNKPPACMQYSDLPFPWYENTTHMSEDCLFLNIWSPAKDFSENPKAVMYWIHGGAFTLGSIRSELYNGKALSALGDIVVVTVNYRLNAFGFLSLSSKNVDYNVGLYDVLEGLKWVNKNIKYFGGDPSRITIAGESAGAFAAGLLSVSPQARGLYSRIILESGAPLNYNGITDAVSMTQSQVLAAASGCGSVDQDNAVECLRGKDAFYLTKTYSKTNPAPQSFPIRDDDIVPVDVNDIIKSGDFNCNDLLIGSNKDEGSIALTILFPEIFGFFGQNVPDFNKLSKDTINKFLPKQLNFVGNAVGNIAQNVFLSVVKQAYTAAGDEAITCQTVYYAEGCAKKGNVHYYLWTHRSSTSPWAPWMGVAHFTEIEFVFGQPILHPEKYEEDEVDLSRKMVHIWSSFVRTGNPGEENWPLYSKDKPIFKNLTIDPDPKFGEGPSETNCNLMRLIM